VAIGQSAPGIVHEFESGKSPEAILQSHSSIGSLAKIFGVITFILEHPERIAAYLRDQEGLWEELKEKHPLPPDMLQRFLRSRELFRKPLIVKKVASKAKLLKGHRQGFVSRAFQACS
jgi:hypothetical protein